MRDIAIVAMVALFLAVAALGCGYWMGARRQIEAETRAPSGVSVMNETAFFFLCEEEGAEPFLLKPSETRRVRTDTDCGLLPSKEGAGCEWDYRESDVPGTSLSIVCAADGGE